MKLKRSHQEEMLDDLAASGPEIDQNLRELAFINKWLGGYRPIFRGLEHLNKLTPQQKHYKIADIGCGGGDVLKAIHDQFKDRFQCEFHGFDANPAILDYAKAYFQQAHYHECNVVHDPASIQNFDVVIMNLFAHHFDEHTLDQLVVNLKSQNNKWLIINDLHRHYVPYYLILFATQLLSNSSMVKNDAPLSVLRGFKKHELARIPKKASVNYQITWHWPFKWLATTQLIF